MLGAGAVSAPMACARCGKPAVPGSFRPYRHAALADAIACTIPGGPMTAVPAAPASAGPARFAQATLFDTDEVGAVS